MSRVRVWISRLLGTVSKSRISDELQFHIDMETEANLRRGMSAEDARAAAVRVIGGVTHYAEQYRDMQGFPMLDAAIRDVRYGLRNMRRAPAFAATAILTLALGTGSATAIFSVVNGVLLRPLPYPEPERLMLVWGHHPQLGLQPSSTPDFIDFRAAAKTADLAAYHQTQYDLAAPGRPATFAAAGVTGNFFRVLGARPLIGRMPTLEEETRPWLVISYAVWKSRFAGDPAVVGMPVANGSTIVAVMPAGFNFPGETQVWTPLSWKARNSDRRTDFLSVVGRLRSTHGIAALQSELDGIASRLETRYPGSNTNRTIRVFRLHDEVVKRSKTPLIALFGAVGCLLLIACSNVANLLLARATSRGREMLVRLSLGASRGRLISQLLVESVLLSIAGGLLGIVIAKGGIDVLVRFHPSLVPRMQEVNVDSAALLFTTAVALMTGILFGLVPALNATRADIAGGLRAAGRSAATNTRTMRALAVSEVAIAMCLLVGAGLFVRSLVALTTIDPGYRRDNVLVARVSLNGKMYEHAGAVPAFHERLLDRVKTLPGVVSAATAGGPPTRGGNYGTWIEEGETPRDDSFKEANFRGVSVNYLATIGLPLIAGRNLDLRDTSNSEQVVLVNSALVRKYFDGRNPIGRRIQADGPWRRIVGVVGDTRQEGLANEPREEILFPMAQRATRGVNLLVRTDGNPEAYYASVRSAIAALDPELPVQLLTNINELTDAELSQPRFGTFLLTAFAAVALFLAALGVYGVTAYGVNRRVHEIGVRMALGAGAADVRAMVVGGGMRMALFGVVAGAILAGALARTISTLLFGVAPYDVFSFVAAAVTFFLVVAVACYLPARRATLVDPASTLRAD